MNRWLRCQGRKIVDAAKGRRWLSPIIVSSNKDSIEIDPEYELMCAAIDDAIHSRYLEAVLNDIVDVESGRIEVIEEETEGWLFWIRSSSVTFEGKFDQGSGGEVTLAQFKFAVSTFRDFLNDPERKPVEVLFPEE